MVAQIYVSSKYCSWIIFAIVLFSCESSKPDLEFTFSEGELNFLDSVKIDEGGSAFNFIFNGKIYQDSLLVFGDGSFYSIHLFNTKTGENINSYNHYSVEDFPLPETGFTTAYISGDSIFLLNYQQKKIYSFDFDKKFLGQRNLEWNDEFGVIDFITFFEKIEGKYYLSTRLDAPMFDTYKFSPMLSKFSKSGTFDGGFGKYPEHYTKGNLSLIKSVNIAQKASEIYIINSVGVPVLKKYDLDGNLVDFLEIKSQIFDPTLSYFKSDPWDSELMDQIIILATDESKDDGIFYLAYTHFKDRDRDSGGETFQYMILKIDTKAMTIKEAELAGPWHYFELRSLLPQVKDDTLSLLIRGFDENLYLKRFTFK
jgi:hypothetical protein